MALLNSAQLALKWLLCEGETDTSHLELSLGARVVWWAQDSRQHWWFGKCTLLLGGTKTINIDIDVYERTVEGFQTAKITIESDLKGYPCSYVDCYDVRVWDENNMLNQKIVTFNEENVIYRFARHFKNSTGLNPFAFP